MRAREMYLLGVLLLVASAASAQMITGTVLLPDGQAAEGAEVHAYGLGFPEPFRAQTAAGPDGRFTLSIDLNRLFGELAVGACAEGFGIGWVSLTEPPGEVEPIEVVLTPEATATGLVVDPEGEPIAGALVRLRDLDLGLSFRACPVPLEMVTAADGTFVLRGVPATDDLASLVVEKPGHITARLDPTPGRYLSDLRVRLQPGCTISGRVTSETGPVENVRLTATRESRWVEPGMALTDEAGNWVIDTVPPGTYTVRVLARLDCVSEPLTGIRVRPGAPVEGLEVALLQGGVVSGTIRDAATGAPAQGALVRGRRADEDHQYVSGAGAVSDRDGRYSLRLPPGAYEVTANQWRGGSSYAVAEPSPVQVERGAQIAAIDLTVTPLAQVEYRIMVLDPDGRPAEGIVVQEGNRTFTTGPDGSFAFRDREDRWIHFEVADEQTGMVGYAILGRGEHEATIQLGPGGWVALRLVDQTGAPILGARCGDDSWTDADGRAVLGPLRTDREQRVSLSDLEQFVAAGVRLERLTVDPGQTLDLGTIVVDRRGMISRGLVTDPEDGPVAGCVVADVLSGVAARTDADGRYELAGLPLRPEDGRGLYYPLIVAGPSESGLSAATTEIAVGTGEEADLVLRAPGAITGRVLAADGQPLIGVTAVAFPGNDDDIFLNQAAGFTGTARVYAETATDDQGHFRLQGLVAGLQYYVACREDGRLVAIATAFVQAGESVDVGNIARNVH